jgi:hypothetical protein
MRRSLMSGSMEALAWNVGFLKVHESQAGTPSGHHEGKKHKRTA